MKFHVITLFPELFTPFFRESLIGKALKTDLVSIELINLRDSGLGKHRQVDDAVYGGGDGMLLRCEPIFSAFEALRLSKKMRRIFLTPQGVKLTQRKVEGLGVYEDVVLLCGRYEGVDQRVRDELIDEEISIGDYVLNGGELPAMVVMESVIRLIPGVVGKEGSVEQDSFSKAFGRKKEHPHYTKPAEFRGLKVPQVLLSGHHREIERWRRQHLR